MRDINISIHLFEFKFIFQKKSCIFLGSVGGGRGRKRDKRMSMQQKEVNCILNDEIK